MGHNCSWNHISNILSLFRSVNLKEASHENIIDPKTRHLNLRTTSMNKSCEPVKNDCSTELAKLCGLTSMLHWLKVATGRDITYKYVYSSNPNEVNIDT